MLYPCFYPAICAFRHSKGRSIPSISVYIPWFICWAFIRFLIMQPWFIRVIFHSIKYPVGEISQGLTWRKDCTQCIPMSSRSGAAPTFILVVILPSSYLYSWQCQELYLCSYWGMASIPTFCNYFTSPPASWGHLCCVLPVCSENGTANPLYANSIM